MNTNNEIQQRVAPKFSLKKACQDYCQKLLAQINQTKQQLFADFREVFGLEDNVLRLALNEAEALAWETDYPHLLFPQLASEKAEAAARWERRQAIINRSPLSLTLRSVRRNGEGCQAILDLAHPNLAFA